MKTETEEVAVIILIFTEKYHQCMKFRSPHYFVAFLSYYFQLKCDVLVSALRALTYSTMPQPLLRYCNN